MTQAAAMRMGAGTTPTWSAGEGVLFFSETDGQLYFRRSDTGVVVGPIGVGTTSGVKHHLESGTSIVIEPTFEYLVQGPLVIDEGASITLNGADARLAVL